jgi:anaerobic dimethyl sulfoxide reductase subunit B (iron-sulfur subunit)
MAKQLAFYLNTSACNGCKVCAIACKSKNALPVGINWRRVTDYGGGSWVQHPSSPSLVLPNNVFAYSVSIACQHCENPLCVDVCPAAAMYKRDDGVVLIDADKCIGCRYCEWACPYGAPQFDAEAGVMTKCTFCEDLLAQGQAPACVDACVMRALEFGELDQLRAKYGTVNAFEPLPPGEITEPALVLTPHRHAQAVGMGTGQVLGLPEEA